MCNDLSWISRMTKDLMYKCTSGLVTPSADDGHCMRGMAEMRRGSSLGEIIGYQGADPMVSLVSFLS